MTEILVDAGLFQVQVDLSHVRTREDAQQTFRTRGDEVTFCGGREESQGTFVLWLRAITDVPKREFLLDGRKFTELKQWQ